MSERLCPRPSLPVRGYPAYLGQEMLLFAYLGQFRLMTQGEDGPESLENGRFDYMVPVPSRGNLPQIGEMVFSNPSNLPQIERIGLSGRPHSPYLGQLSPR